MMLTDAGPLIAIGDHLDAAHARCIAAIRAMEPPMLTTIACVAEALHVLGARKGWRAQDGLLSLIERGSLEVAGLEHSEIVRCRVLMDRYRSVPMDFADATLVAVAEKRGVSRVFTLDSDFRVYRVGRRHFEIVP
jgi:uncharacterized protein